MGIMIGRRLRRNYYGILERFKKNACNVMHYYYHAINESLDTPIFCRFSSLLAHGGLPPIIHCDLLMR